MTQEALAAGKHVYVEKPMTHRWEEGEAFIAAVEKSGKVLQVGSQYMSMGCAQQAADLIKSGRLGQITLVEGRFHRNTATGAWYTRSRPTPRRSRWTSRASSARPRRTIRPAALLPVAALLGLLGRAADRPLRAPGDRHPPADGRPGAGERRQLRRHLPLEELPRGAGPDDLDGQVLGGFVLRLSSTAGNGHPGPLLTFYGSEGTLEYTGSSFKYFHEPRSDSFGYSTTPGPRPPPSSSSSS